MTEDPNPVFRALLQAVCAEAGMDLPEDSPGIEFEADGHVTLIVPDPRQDDRMHIEVSVLTLPALGGDRLMALHQLNHAARLDHDWVITIDVANRVCMHTQRAVAGCKASDLQSLLAEGIERAQALCAVLQELDQGREPVPTPAVAVAADQGRPQMIRG